MQQVYNRVIIYEIIKNRSIAYVIVVVALLFISFSTLNAQLIHEGHAHNDYEHERPLFEALSYGFTSIEVDIHPVGRKLRVSHDREDCKKKPSLEELYIRPLDSLISSQKGLVFDKDSTQLTLMIDLKTKKSKALRRLHKLFKRYDHLFQKHINGKSIWGPIIILISGEPPLSKWQAIDSPYMYLDGRANVNYPRSIEEVVRRISGNIFTISSNNALINGDQDEINKLRKFVRDLYNKGILEVRFWATQDNEQLWASLLQAGVNKISVDDLKGFATFMNKDDYSR